MAIAVTSHSGHSSRFLVDSLRHFGDADALQREVPVRRTFIDFGCRESEEAFVRRPPASTPASVERRYAAPGGALAEALSRALAAVAAEVQQGGPIPLARRSPSRPGSPGIFVAMRPRQSSSQLPETRKLPDVALPPPAIDIHAAPSASSFSVAGPPAAAIEERPLPDVLYKLSPSSAKAAGLWSRGEEMWSRGETFAATRYAKLGSSGKAASSTLGPTPTRAEPLVTAAPLPDEAGHEADAASWASSDEEDSDDDDQGVCPQYHEGAEPPSIGSAGHGGGTCKRCCFFPKGRCNNGYDCPFCHFAHEKRKTKKKKAKKNRRKHRSSAQGDASAACVPPPRASGYATITIDTQEVMMPPGYNPYPAVKQQGQFVLVQAAMPASFMAIPNAHASMAMVQVPFCLW